MYFLINHNADSALDHAALPLSGASFEAAEEPFEAGGHKFNRGSFIVRNVAAGDLGKAGAELGVQAYAVASAPSVKTHPARAARIAIMHTWYSTQTRGLVAVGIRPPEDSLRLHQHANRGQPRRAICRSKYDVIVFPPGIRNPQTVINGMPMYGNPLPWKVTALTPNLGKTDQTDDMRPGLGWTGLEHLQEFVRKGGLLITANDSTNFAVAFGFTPGVSIARRAKAEGDRFGAAIQDGGCGQPHRVRLQRQPGDLRLESAGFQSVEHGGRRRRPAGERSGGERNAPPGEARPTIRMCRKADRPRRFRKSRTRKPGRRCH